MGWNGWKLYHDFLELHVSNNSTERGISSLIFLRPSISVKKQRDVGNVVGTYDSKSGMSCKMNFPPSRAKEIKRRRRPLQKRNELKVIIRHLLGEGDRWVKRSLIWRYDTLRLRLGFT